MIVKAINLDTLLSFFIEEIVERYLTMNHTRYKFYLFLRAVQGNWRNAFFLKCDSQICPYGQTPACAGYLLTADDNGTLLLMPVSYFQHMTGETVEANECIGILTRSTFEKVYHLYIEWNTISDKECSLKQLCPGLDI